MSDSTSRSRARLVGPARGGYGAAASPCSPPGRREVSDPQRVRRRSGKAPPCGLSAASATLRDPVPPPSGGRMNVIESTPEFVESVYAKMSTRLAAVRKRLNRPLTLTEKILLGHLDDPQGA